MENLDAGRTAYVALEITKNSEPEERRIIVTTALSTAPENVEKARRIAQEIGAVYFERRNNGMLKTFALSGADRALIVESGELALFHRDGTIYRYHPNLGFVRSMNLINGRRDPYVEAADLRPGLRILDCTLGFAGEAILAAMVIGDSGRIVGLESVPELAILTREGLANRVLDQKRVMAAMRRIEVVTAGYQAYLESAGKGEFDVICFDPFFEKRIEGSEININPLFRFGNTAPLHAESVLRAMEIAPRVVVKHPRDIEMPEALTVARTQLIATRGRPIAYSLFLR